MSAALSSVHKFELLQTSSQNVTCPRSQRFSARNVKNWLIVCEVFVIDDWVPVNDDANLLA